MSLTGTTASSDEPDSVGEHCSDHASPSHIGEEFEVSDLESAGPDCEELQTSRQVLDLSLIQVRFLALYSPGLRDWGTVNGTQTGIFKLSF